MTKNLDIFDSFIRFTNDMVQGVDENGRIVFANISWLNTLGYSLDEATQMQFDDIFHSQFTHTDERPLEIMNQADWESICTTLKTKKGEVLHVEGSMSSLAQWGDATVSVAIFRDVTEQVNRDKQLRGALNRARALYQVSHSITDYEKLPHLLQIVTDQVAETLQADRVILYTFDVEEKIVMHFVKGGPNADGIVFYSFEALMESLNGWAIKNKKTAFAKKGERDGRVSDTIFDRREALDIGSIIISPFHYQGNSIGTLTAINGFNQPDFTEQDVELLDALGRQAAMALENVRLYEAEQERTAELHIKNEELDAFAHTVAHDLKAPLGNLLGFLDLMHDKKAVDEESQRYMDYIKQSGYKMVNIIDELLLLSQVRRADVVIMPLDMNRIIDSVLDRIRHHRFKADSEIILPERWPVAEGHAAWVEEIWLNYMSNALKYGGRPPSLELAYREFDDEFIRFQITDNGEGIAEDQQAELFTPFERLEQVGQIEGYGLGLSIVRRIAEKLGGNVGVESIVGLGSTFYFTLPRAR